MPSNLRSKIQSGPLNRSCVNVAAIGTSHSGNEAISTDYADYISLSLFVTLRGLQLHRQTFNPHDRQRVSCRAWTRSQAIIKDHAAVVHFLTKVKISNSVDLVG